MDGWIKLHRKIADNPYYFSEKFTRSQAWIDLLIIANHKEGYFFKRGVKVVVKRGQCGYDIDSLAKRWGWSRGKASRFILDLETDRQIVRQKNNVTTLITILNYEEYQGSDKADSKASSTASDTANGQQTDTNKNDNNDKNYIYISDEKIFENEINNWFDENFKLQKPNWQALYPVANLYECLKDFMLKNAFQTYNDKNHFRNSFAYTLKAVQEKNQKEKSSAKKEKVDPISKNPHEYYATKR